MRPCLQKMRTQHVKQRSHTILSMSDQARLPLISRLRRFSIFSRLTGPRSTSQSRLRNGEKLLTIVMPFRNEGDEPRKTIESIYDTAPSSVFEIIAIDDASNGPAQSFDDFADVHSIRNEYPMGSAGCKHVGAMMAQTPYVFIIDAHMRFKRDNWSLKLIDALEAEPNTAFCTVCIGLDQGQMNVHFPKGKYYGANLVFVDGDPASDRPARQILEPKWAQKQDGPAYEIPCILGANYGFSSQWFRRIRGLEGLQMWGTEEPFLSLKTWLAGGACKILTDIEIGHKFRSRAPYRTQVFQLVYNKIFVCRTILPDSLGDKLIGYLPRNAEFRQALQLIEANEVFVKEARAYYHRLFRRSIYDFCDQFDIQLPE